MVNKKSELEQMRDHVEEIRNDLSEMRKSIGEMYTALVGNAVRKDGGLIKKIDDLETKFNEQVKSNDRLKEKYTQIKWLVVGIAIGAGILGFSLKDVIHLFTK